MEVKPLVFLREVRSELEQVTWPSRKEVTRLTAIVVIGSVATGAFIGGLDFTFTNIMTLVLKQ